MSVSVAIKSLISRREMSVLELSKKSGVSYATLKRFISSDHDISSKKLVLILQALDIDLSNLIAKSCKEESAHKELPNYLKKSLSKFIQGVQFGA